MKNLYEEVSCQPTHLTTNTPYDIPPYITVTIVGLSDLALDFLRALLEHDPKRRANAYDILNHPFLYDHHMNRLVINGD